MWKVGVMRIELVICETRGIVAPRGEGGGSFEQKPFLEALCQECGGLSLWMNGWMAHSIGSVGIARIASGIWMAVIW